MMIILVGLIVMAGIKMFGGGIAGKADFANDMVGSVTTENQEAERLRAAGRKAEERRRAHGGAASGAAEGSEAGGGEARHEEGGAQQAARAPAPATSAATSKEAGGADGGGFNPFLIPIVVGLLGLLGYVMLKSQKG